MIIDKPIIYYVTKEQIAKRLSNQITYLREAIKPTDDKSNLEVATFLIEHIIAQMHDLENFNEIKPSVLP